MEGFSEKQKEELRDIVRSIVHDEIDQFAGMVNAGFQETASKASTRAEFERVHVRLNVIEMMVVIAVIGILSAAVLAGLGPSRQKARDARIITELTGARGLAESLY